MKSIDTRGLLCPTPLIMTKRTISEASAGEQIEVLSDNDTAKCNLLDYISELGYKATCTTNGNEHLIIFNVDTARQPTQQSGTEPKVEQFCSAARAQHGDYAVVIKGEHMGNGDPKLGALLMRSCINSLCELDSLPQVIVLYNGGVLLATTGSDTAQSLQTLKDKGVEIIVCGTCVDFYGIKETLAIGTISNMYKINSVLSQTGHIVYP